jgi:cytochrome c oxidase subunit II
MTNSNQKLQRRVLIASANQLFGKGLEKLFVQKWGGKAIQIRLATSMAETIYNLENWRPDLVVVDYDDHTINRAEFLNHFVSDERPMQVVLVSLQANGRVVVYDRRTLTPDQAENWLNLPWFTNISDQESSDNETA